MKISAWSMVCKFSLLVFGDSKLQKNQYMMINYNHQKYIITDLENSGEFLRPSTVELLVLYFRFYHMPQECK